MITTDGRENSIDHSLASHSLRFPVPISSCCSASWRSCSRRQFSGSLACRWRQSSSAQACRQGCSQKEERQGAGVNTACQSIRGQTLATASPIAHHLQHAIGCAWHLPSSEAGAAAHLIPSLGHLPLYTRFGWSCGLAGPWHVSGTCSTDLSTVPSAKRLTNMCSRRDEAEDDGQAGL